MSKDVEQTLIVGSFTAAGFATLIMAFAIMNFSLGGGLSGGFLYAVAYGLWRMTGRPLFPDRQ